MLRATRRATAPKSRLQARAAETIRLDRSTPRRRSRRTTRAMGRGSRAVTRRDLQVGKGELLAQWIERRGGAVIAPAWRAVCNGSRPLLPLRRVLVQNA